MGPPADLPVHRGTGVRGLDGRVVEVTLDRIVEVAYAATVRVEGPQRTALVDARASDALNLAVLTDAPVSAAPDVLAYCIGRQAGDSAEATLMRRALTVQANKPTGGAT